jgi:transposase
MQAEVAGTVTAAFVDQGYTGAQPAADAAAQGVELLVVKHAGPRRGFVLLPRRWVMERTFASMANFRRLTRDYERVAETLRALHVSAPRRHPARSRLPRPTPRHETNAVTRSSPATARASARRAERGEQRGRERDRHQ